MMSLINLLAFVFVTKNNTALAEQFPKLNIIAISEMNLNINISLSFDWCIMRGRIMLYTIKYGRVKKHNNNIIRILNFVIFLLILSELTILVLLNIALDIRIVLIWSNIVIPIIIISTERWMGVTISHFHNKKPIVIITAWNKARPNPININITTILVVHIALKFK